MQQDNRFNELAQKWLNGTITEDEKKEFNEWYERNGDQPLHIPQEFATSEEALQQRIWQAVSEQRKAKVMTLKRHGFLKVAAAVLVIACSAAFYVYLSRQNAPAPAGSAPVAKRETTPPPAIVPGGNKAVLVLGDGTSVILDTTANGTIAQAKNARVEKLGDGQLAYSPLKGGPAALTYNTLSTPRGGQYHITLADGTRVWLNAASSLRFPVAFTGAERLVELTGEGYFEVVKNTAQPFKVKVGDMEIRVLGTHFNVMAYQDEETANTTLLEGAVRISKKEVTALLKPGQQAQVSPKGRIKVQQGINTEEAVAWKNGYFNFEGTSIETIMRQLERWYDIDVEYKNHVNTRFYGTIARNVGIDKVFKMLELTGAVHFTINGSKVVVRS